MEFEDDAYVLAARAHGESGAVVEVLTLSHGRFAAHVAGGASRKPVTHLQLAELRARGEPIVMLTCYDASFASLLDDVGIECLLIGDSLGMVVQGHDSTLPVTLDEVAYHTRCVAHPLV